MTKYTKKFDDFSQSVLIIVDVQKPFSTYFPDNYVEKLKKLASKIDSVYQIWDSNNEGVKDYEFPNEVLSIEKQFGGKPEIELLTPNSKEDFMKDNQAQYFFNEHGNGNAYNMTDGRILIYVGMGGQGPGHEWFIIPKDVVSLFKELKNSPAMIFLAGGADFECLYDIEVALHFFNINFKKLDDYIYKANPIE